MGGGDSLFDQIDKGIRGCKVVLSCVTNKYALSANCRREVSLADALKKPIIPLLLEENFDWPPEGPMSMVFTQLIYIDFSKVELDMQEQWKSSQMETLYGKINQTISVDQKSSQGKCIVSNTKMTQNQIDPQHNAHKHFDLKIPSENGTLENTKIIMTTDVHASNQSGNGSNTTEPQNQKHSVHPDVQESNKQQVAPIAKSSCCTVQ